MWNSKTSQLHFHHHRGPFPHIKLKQFEEFALYRAWSRWAFPIDQLSWYCRTTCFMTSLESLNPSSLEIWGLSFQIHLQIIIWLKIFKRVSSNFSFVSSNLISRLTLFITLGILLRLVLLSTFRSLLVSRDLI